MPVVIFTFVFAATALATWAIDALLKRLSSGGGEAAHHRVPDYVSPIVAYRIWMWDGSKLKSLNGEGWRPNQPLVAKCLPGHSMVGSGHHAPHDGCTCGIYATKSPDPELTGWWLGIYGEVYLWGTVVEHESGWRAQYAYPKRLVLSPPLVSTVLGTRVARSPWYCLATLAKYGVDIYLADATENIPLWLARSGYDIEGLKRFRKVIWADDIKGEPQYSDDGTEGGNRPDGGSSSQNVGYGDLLRHRYWHFVDTPWSPDHAALADVPAPNAKTQIAAFRAVLASSQPVELKSYDLVWLLHLIGDIHQPLHASTRVTQSDMNGDAGGNKVTLNGDAASNLHSYWDDLPGSDCRFCNDKIRCVNRAIVFAKNLKTPSSRAGYDTNTATWIRESFDDAQTVTYQAPIGIGAGPFTIVPWSNYEVRAYRLAQKRIALSGIRLAEVLNAELK
jgi:S1/P1 Nuclease